MAKTKKVLVLGVSGLLGSTLFRIFCLDKKLNTRGTVRKLGKLNRYFSKETLKKITFEVNVDKFKSVENVIKDFKPDIVVNCIGLINKGPESSIPERAIYLNALFPHLLANVCIANKTRLIHISTDCVFSGKKGMYTEDDVPDAVDLYGRTKTLGEVNRPGCLTVRTSIIGHELSNNRNLVSWFLSQTKSVKGYSKVIFTGFPTVELAKILSEYIFTHPSLDGLIQISSDPISKYKLLKLIAKQYDKQIPIVKDSSIIQIRSLNSLKFRKLSGYQPPSWPDLIKSMYLDYKN